MTKPGRYLAPMLLFVVAVCGLAYLLFAPLQRVFQTNQVLNAAILAVLWIGVLQVLGRVLKLAPEITWAEARRRPEPGLAIEDSPTLLAPMAAMLGDRLRVSLSPASARALLDSIGARLEESREITRYLVGLLIFLGLLGTFWGLLDTVSAVSDVIKTLSIGTGDVTRLFADLQAGLSAPLSGMGTAFGSSLFGLSGSLVLGFLDLLAGQAQNRFYNELEEWIASITAIGDGDVDAGAPSFLRGMVEQTADRLDNVARALATVEGSRARLDTTLGTLADRLGAIAERFGAQEQLTRSLAERQMALEPVLQRLTAPAPSPTAGGASPETARAGLEHLRGIERTLDRLAKAVESPPPLPPPVAPPVHEIDQQALAHLQRLDEAMHQLVQLSEASRPAGLDDAARRHLASIDAALQRLAALGAVAASGHVGQPPPSAAQPVLEAGINAQLALIEQHLARIADQPPAQLPAHMMAPPPPDAEIGPQLARIEQHLARIADQPPVQLPAHMMAPPPDADIGPQLARIEQHLAHIADQPPAPQVAAAPASDERVVMQLHGLDETLRHVATLVEAIRPEAIAPMLREHLASIDEALRQIAAVSADPVARSDAAPAPAGAMAADDGAMLAHLASIEQHLQHIARDSGQVQHRVAAEVRGELRHFAQSIAGLAEEPPAAPEP